MIRKILRLVLCFALILPLAGCWNYKDTDELSIVVGIAVDFDEKYNRYVLTHEVADLSGASDESGISSRIVVTDGQTLFEAVRNAKRKEEDKLFFGSPQVLIISQKFATDYGISEVIEWFIRDAECRETITVAISQEETASVILHSAKEDKGIMALRLNDIIREDNKFTSTTIRAQLFQIYNDINSPKRAAVLPAIHRANEGTMEVSEANGLAILKGDKLVGFLGPHEARYFLMVESMVEGGIMSLSVGDTVTDDLSIEILEDKGKKSFSYENGQFTFHIKIDAKIAISENQAYLDLTDKKVIEEIEEKAAEKIKQNVSNVMYALQQEFRTDALGFCDLVYKKDNKLWKQVADQWDEIFPKAQFDVETKTKILSTAFTR